MTGRSHTDPEATPFALEVMEHMNQATAAWKAKEHIDFSLYGTPLESTTYKFAKCLQKRFGVIEGITDKGYITNSYHVHVAENIDAFDKLEFEAQFQHLSPGGAISYVEVPNMQNNLEAVLQIIRFIYDNIIYAELNTKSDYCQVCGWDGEIQIAEEDGKLVWECPKCGNREQSKLNVARRTCGYIGTQFWNQGRTQEIKGGCSTCKEGGSSVLRQHQALRHRQRHRGAGDPLCLGLHPPLQGLLPAPDLGLWGASPSSRTTSAPCSPSSTACGSSSRTRPCGPFPATPGRS